MPLENSCIKHSNVVQILFPKGDITTVVLLYVASDCVGQVTIEKFYSILKVSFFFWMDAFQANNRDKTFRIKSIIFPEFILS